MRTKLRIRNDLLPALMAIQVNRLLNRNSL
jgi:hypothetical protein